MPIKHRVPLHQVTHPHSDLITLLVAIFTLAILYLSLQVLPAKAANGITRIDTQNATQNDSQVGLGIAQVGSNASRRGASSTKAGSLLFFPKYTSDATAASSVNTLLTITNTNPRDPIAVRVFFVHDCIVEDIIFSLVANQSRTLVASKESLGQTGYAIALAINSQGLPTR